MDFITLIKIMLRRWWVVIPVLVVAGVVGSQFVNDPQVSYAGSGSALLIRSVPDNGETGNPFINSSQAGGILASALDQQGFRASLRARGLDGDFEIELNQTQTVLTVRIVDPDRATTLATGETLAAEIDELLTTVIGPEQAASVRVVAVSQPTDDDVVRVGNVNALSVAFAILDRGEPANPFPPSASTVRTMLDLADRQTVASAVRDVTPNVSFDVTADARASAPIIGISVVSPERQSIPVAYDAVVSALQAELDQLQGSYGVTGDARTVVSPLTTPTSVVQTSSSEVRVIAGIGLLAVAVACALAVLVDTLLVRRRSRRVEADPVE